MKYIKTFENVYLPEIGDFVICEIPKNIAIDKLTNFLNNNVGKIVHIIKPDIAVIKYDFVPSNLQSYFLFYTPEDMINKGEWLYDINRKYFRLATEKDVENQTIKNSTNKYNL